jgi:hypothetical protein
MVRFLLACLLLVLTPAASQAATRGIDINKIPKIKEYPPSEEFDKKTKIVHEDAPYSEKLLSYELRLPRSWTDNVQQPPVEASIGSLSDTVLGLLGRYIGSPVNLMRSYITVEGQGMTYEISAMHWFLNFILLNGFSLTAMTEKSPQEIEALYVEVQKDQTFIVRTRVVVNGNRLMMIRYYLPQDNYEIEKEQQARVIASFSPTDPTRERIEKQETYGFLDQSYFNYPQSWRLKERSILSIERMSALLFQERKDGKESILEGHIKINVISRLLKTTLSQEIAAFRKALNIKDYEIGDLLDVVEYKYDPTVKYGKAQIYKLVPADPTNMKSYEFLVTVMQGDEFFYITSMITPSREQDFYSWARNMEAARIINESMRRNIKTDAIDPNDPYFDYLDDAQGAANIPPSAGGDDTPSDVPLRNIQ